MNPLSLIVSAVSGVVSFIGRRVERADELAAVRANAEVEVAKAEAGAKVAAWTKLQENESAADLILVQQQDQSWKDEWFTLLLSIPAVLCFFPSGRVWVTEGFTALDSAPDWYVVMLGLAVATAFGYRRLVDLMVSLRKPGRR